MSLFDEEPRKKKRTHEVGEDISRLSIDELGERIALLQEEIARLSAERESRGATQRAADALFRR